MTHDEKTARVVDEQAESQHTLIPGRNGAPLATRATDIPTLRCHTWHWKNAGTTRTGLLFIARPNVLAPMNIRLSHIKDIRVRAGVLSELSQHVKEPLQSL